MTYFLLTGDEEADSEVYDVDVRYFDDHKGRSELGFYINGVMQGDPWTASKNENDWMTRVVSHVAIRQGDEVSVSVRGHRGESTKLDYIQLNYSGCIH